MQKDEIIDIIDDRLAKRFESYAQAQNAIHQEFHQKVVETVESSIKSVVNGKIDAFRQENKDMYIELKGLIKGLEEKTAPGVEIVTTTKNTGKFVLWLSGIVGALVGLWKLIKL